MDINDILNKVSFKFTIHGTNTAKINDLTINSNEVKDSSCFFAVKGNSLDGHDYITKAINNGASVIFCEVLPEELHTDVMYVLVDDTNIVIGSVASIFFGNPSQKLKIIGVTGTNGKTTVATIIYKMFIGFHRKVGLIGTVGDFINEQIAKTVRLTPTTPDAISLHKLFLEMVDAGCEYAVMEVSSHAVVQHRIDGINFTGGVFTNLSHDHLDFHHTIENYANAKKSFFDSLGENAWAVTNTDDEYGRLMVRDSLAHIYTYGFSNTVDFGEIIDSRLIGRFNQYNILAAYSVFKILGFEEDHIKSIIKTVQPPRGRFELAGEFNGIKTIVDYAHTPDGVENVLSAVKEINTDGRIIAILGCGGDRDKAKRPVMARIMYDMADVIILTSDNPRSEDPESIINEMKSGLPVEMTKPVFTVVDRRSAILKSKEIGTMGDIVIVMGKGHEDYQEINGVKNHFDDKEELIKAFSV